MTTSPPVPAIGVLTDSTSDITPASAQRRGLGLVPLTVSWDNESFRDGVDLNPVQFYERLRASKTSPKTGAPSLAAFDAAYRAMLERHQEVVAVILASKLSATFDVAARAAQDVAPDRISVVDSGTVSIGTAWLVEAAQHFAADGMPRDEIVRALEILRTRVRILFTLETLTYLQRGGRIGRAQAIAGTLLNVKPLLALREGEVHPLERVRTMPAALRRMVDVAVGMGAVERVAVMDADAASGAEAVQQMLLTAYPGMMIERGQLGPVLGTHGGPGTVGVGVLLRDGGAE